MASPIPFMSEVFTLLSTGIGRVCSRCEFEYRWIMGIGSSSCFVLLCDSSLPPLSARFTFCDGDVGVL
jgi:hypothetical protein